jgi:GxxExxY protein
MKRMKVALDSELEALTGQIIGAAIAVSNGLGHGFLETVYRNSLIEELLFAGLPVQSERPFTVQYRGKRVGVYVADLVVADRVIVELKAVAGLTDGHVAQVVNYLKASGLSVGLLMNFGSPRLQWRRVLP